MCRYKAPRLLQETRNLKNQSRRPHIAIHRLFHHSPKHLWSRLYRLGNHRLPLLLQHLGPAFYHGQVSACAFSHQHRLLSHCAGLLLAAAGLCGLLQPPAPPAPAIPAGRPAQSQQRPPASPFPSPAARSRTSPARLMNCLSHSPASLGQR
ncbi:MAG TPA: hypothetical protein DEA73_04975 [Peptococcaceae bacterium]|nr:hypothetical protein [Peptococcaceae bacterium]